VELESPVTPSLPLTMANSSTIAHDIVDVTVANYFHIPTVVKPVQHGVSSADCARRLEVQPFRKFCRSVSISQRDYKPIARQQPQSSSKLFTKTASRHQIGSIQGQDDDVRDQPDDSMGDDDDGAHAFTVDDATKFKQPVTSVTRNGTCIKGIIDSGASVNILDESTFQKFENKPPLQIARTNAYGSKTHAKH